MSILQEIRYGKITRRNHFQKQKRSALMSYMHKDYRPGEGLFGDLYYLNGCVSTVVEAKFFGRNKHLLAIECSSVEEKDAAKINLPRFLCAKKHFTTKMAIIENAHDHYCIVTDYIGTFKDCQEILKRLGRNYSICQGFLESSFRHKQMILPCYPKRGLVPRLLTYYQVYYHGGISHYELNYQTVRNLHNHVIQFPPPNIPINKPYDIFMQWIKNFYHHWNSTDFAFFVQVQHDYIEWTESESYLAEISCINAFLEVPMNPHPINANGWHVTIQNIDPISSSSSSSSSSINNSNIASIMGNVEADTVNPIPADEVLDSPKPQTVIEPFDLVDWN